MHKALNKISDISEFVNPSPTHGRDQFYGLFSYEEPDFDTGRVLDTLQECVKGERQRMVNCISFGKDYFVRYWPSAPNDPAGQGYYKWHAYHLENKAPAYFIHNVIDHLCPEWASHNNEVWYPEDGKENYKVAEKFLYLPEQVR